MGIGGLALASAVSSTVSAVILIVPMQKKYNIVSKMLVIQIIKMIVSAVIMAAAVLLCKNTVALNFRPSFITSLLEVGIPTGCGVIIYMVLTRVLAVPYARQIFGFATKFVKGKMK